MPVEIKLLDPDDLALLERPARGPSARAIATLAAAIGQQEDARG